MSLLQKIKYFITNNNLELSLRLQYFYHFHKRLNLKNPKTLDEKIQWMKLNLYGYHQDPIYTQCADKLKVRDYVQKCGCGHLLNELIAVYKSAKEIDWDSLPQKFVIKWNFGNGYNIICHDKNKLDIPKTIKQLSKWEKDDAWLKTGEVQYRYIPKRIIVEKFIESDNGVVPEDYKIYCFHGVPDVLFLCTGRELGKPKFYFFNEKWKLQRINPDSIKAPENFEHPKPPHLEEMFHYAALLSKRFPFVRVDFYDTPQQLYFGELTFTPGGGFDTARLPSTQLMFGDKLNLDIIETIK